LKYATECEKEVKRIRLKYLRTKKAMKLAKAQIIAIKKEGFDIEVPLKLFKLAEEALKNNEFENAITRINSCIENLTDLTLD
jgi:transcriptional/translational regulatory protein YebC/TACO1